MKAIFKIPKALSYNGDKRNWNKFKQNFDIYMKATGLVNNDSENKVNIFLNIAGEEALEIFNNLKLNLEEKKDFDRVIEAFEEYISSKQNVIYKSFKFFTRVQQPGEFFIDFYNDLQIMADFCNFGDQKERLIRDRVIVGIRNHDLQGNFLKAPDLSLEQVVNECVEDELMKMNNGNLKMEVLNEETVNEEELIDEETNNNYEELLDNRTNSEEEFSFNQIHVPDEILFNDLAAEEEVDYAVVDHDNNVEEERNYIDVEQSNIEEYISIVNEEIELDDEMDIKPMRNNRSYIKENNMCSSTSIKKEKLQEKKKKAEVIQMKIAEIKERLCNDIRKEVDRERMGISQKLTRSKVKQFSVKSEFTAEIPEVQVGEEIHDKTHCKDSESEGEVPYECDDDPDYEVDTDVRLPIFREYEEVEGELVNGLDENGDKIGNSEGVAENDDTKTVNQMAELEFRVEQQTGQKLNVARSPLSRKRRTKEKGMNEGIQKEFTVFELKRDNLPPVILKTVKKRTKTLIVGKMPYPCKKCDSSFWTSVQLERHQMVHVLKKVAPSNSAVPKKVFKCEVCGKEFKKICDLERHTRVHTGEKPSVCNICNKRFQQAYNLHKHLLTHTQEKNFECVICQKRFGRSDVLNRHVLTHSIDKPYHCSICQKTFIRNTQLKLHLRKHHGMSASQANAAATEKETGPTSAPPSTAREEINDPPVAGTSSA